MRAFIPAGTEVAITRDGVNQWYTTQKEITLTDYATAPCPLRNALPVLTAEVQGFRIWFLENQVKVELTVEQTEFVNNHKFVKVEYDVPAFVTQHATLFRDENGRSFVHPSQWMWGFAVRTSESVWMMTEEKYNALQRRLNRLSRAGCKWEPTWVDASDAGRQLQRAVINLRKAWVEADQSYETCNANAEEEYNNSNMSVEAERKWRYARNRFDKELDKKRENIRQSAVLYGIPMDWVNGTVKTISAPLNGKPTVATSVSQVARANAQEAKNAASAQCDMVDTLRASGHEAVANAVESGEMPHDIAVDFCEENGVAVNEDGSFSLSDLLKDK